MDTFLPPEVPLPAELQSRVDSELRQGERVLWVGQPQPGRAARGAIPFVLFGIPFGGFAIFWISMASGIFDQGPKETSRLIFSLFGIPFLLTGLGMLTAPYWVMRKARKTVYAVTNHRAILWEAGLFRSVEVRSYDPAALHKIVRVDYPNGVGDLVFEEVLNLYANNSNNNARMNRRGFMGISNVRAVEELIRQALLADGASPDAPAK